MHVTMLRESFTEEGHLSTLGLKDEIKTGQKGLGGRKSGGKKSMDVGILLQRGRSPAWSAKCGKGSDGKVQQLR